MKHLTTLLLLMGLLAAPAAADDHNEVRLTHLSEADGYTQSRASNAIQDRQGFVWIASWNGLQRYDGYRFRGYHMRPGDHSPLRVNRITSLQEREDGDLLCCTSDSLFFVFHRRSGQFEPTDGDYRQRPPGYRPDSAVVRQVDDVERFRSGYRHILLKDRQGGIWVDTHSGLFRLWQGRKPLEPAKAGTQAEEEVRGLLADKAHRLWVADKNGYVRLLAADRSLLGYLTPQGRLTPAATPFGQSVYCIFEDSQGSVWLGAKPGGLTRLTPTADGHFKVQRYVHNAADRYSLSSDNVYAMAEDAWHRLWIATYQGGLNMLDLRTPHSVFLHSGNGLVGWPTDEWTSRVRCLLITPEQTLVAGTLNGLYTCALQENTRQLHFHQHQRRADDAASLAHNWVADLQWLDTRQIAVATSGGGISLADSRRLLSDSLQFRTLTTDQGLASDECLALLDDRRGGLYVVTNTAIGRYDLKGGYCTNFMRGVLGDDYNMTEAKPVVTPDGRYVFGTTQGLLDIRPADLRRSSYQPNIVFEDTPYGDAQHGIRLPSDQHSLTIRFAAIDYNRTGPLTYAYRIDGMTDQWTYITDPQIVLPDIEAGHYTLHLLATNGDGVWTDQEYLLDIHRRAAFHETPWAWMLYGLLLALALVAAAATVRYVRRLQDEIKDIRLTSNERLEVMSNRLREMLSIRESVEKMDTTGDIDNEEDRLFAEHARQYIDTNLADASLSVNDFAREMAVSRTILFARMKSIFGTSPNNFLLNRRIEHAKQQLRNPNAYVTDVAYSNGFSDPKYFSKCFKKLTGMTPSGYQKAANA